MVEATEREVHVYVTTDGRSPFEDWLTNLRDKRAKAKVLSRLDRVRLGNLGDCRGLQEGVSELRIDQGPGYRVYFGQHGAVVVILLCGGDKRTQSRDIETALEYWKEFRNHADEALRRSTDQ